MGFLPNLLVGMCVALASLSSAPALAGISSDSPIFLAAGEIVINELMFDPYWDEATEEWVELRNPGAVPVNIANWTLSDQDGEVDFLFPDIDFPAGGFALVRIGFGQNSTAFVDGKAEFFMSKTAGIWTATGDDVLLADAAGATVDFLSYGDWAGTYVDPAPADFPYEHSNATAPEGFSLALAGGAWKPSVPTPLAPNGDDAAPKVLISAVLYYPYLDNEFIEILNPTGMDLDVSGWYISDLEGMMAFPEDTIIPAGDSMTVCQNPGTYASQALTVPDFEYQELNSSIPDMLILNYVPVLANEGDEVFLHNRFGTMIDSFVYGSSAYSGEGWVGLPAKALKQGQVARRPAMADTNSSADWDCLRPYYLGQSSFLPETFDVPGGLTLFSSPDSSFDAVAGAIDSADSSLWLSVYEFTSQALALRLCNAAERGVEVRVFLEGAPVGGITDIELHLARAVVESGGEVRILTSDPGDDIYDRYDYVHSKYAVIDGEKLLITSENWSPSGIPDAGTIGNRGWGAIIDDPAVAAYFSGVFVSDWNPKMPDSVSFDAAHELWDMGENSTQEGEACSAHFSPLTVTSSCSVTPVLSPDTSLSEGTILGMLASATERVLVEEFYIYTHWGSRADGSPETTPNLYLEAVIDAARRGCEVRVLLDSTYYNTDSDDPIDNDDTVTYVNSIAQAEGLDLEAKLVSADHDFTKIHNKGLIADDSVLISSINWNLNSVTMNREAGIIIGNAEAAEYFAGIFEYDWKDDNTRPFAHFSAPEEHLVNTTLCVNATTSSDDVGIVNYTWVLDDSFTSYGIGFIRMFTSPGPHYLELTVWDAWGNSDSYGRWFNVTQEAPEPDDDPPDDDVDDTDDPAGEDDVDDNSTAEADDPMERVVLVLLFLPIVFFIAILAVVLMRRRR